MANLGVLWGGIQLGQSQDAQKVPVTLVDATDNKALETGVSSPTIQISKNGGSYASASDGTWAEVGNGDYTVRLNATDTSELGFLILRVEKTSVSAETKVICKVSLTPSEERSALLRTRTLHRGR